MSKEPESDSETMEVEGKIVEIKKKKAKCKSAFTRYRNRLEEDLKDDDTTDEHLKDSLDRLEACMDAAVETIFELSDLYKQLKQKSNMINTVKESELIEKQYEETMTLYRKRVVGSDIEDAKTPTKVTPNLEKDMAKHLKRVAIPTFHGDKRKYQPWKAAFVACVDQSDCSDEYKLLQLRQYLSGAALKCIENLGHSPAAYKAAVERLDRKFGGEQRQVAIFLEELESFPAFKEENCHTLEKFADLLDIAIINLKEHKKEMDLGCGALYMHLQKKMPETMLTRYNRWIFENFSEDTESVETLRDWVIQESRFHMRANEAVHGLGSKRCDKRPAQTYFTKNNENPPIKRCKICAGTHKPWDCKSFKQLPVEIRWEKAKEHKLCFRCLSDDHQGRDCPRKWTCKFCKAKGSNKSHHFLLHSETERQRPQAVAQDTSERNGTYNAYTAETTNQSKPKIALRTVPVIIQSGKRKMRINALLDDGSTKSYINADIAAELGLRETESQIRVSVLNGKVETFGSMSITVGIESLNGQVKKQIEVQTIKSVTGNLPVVDWNKYSDRYPHLREIEFPKIRQNEKVEMMIGLDYAELHMSLHEICGQPGEPIARLTPLGWTCVGPVENDAFETFHSYFAREQDSELACSVRRFWEIENSGLEQKVLSKTDKEVLETAENSIRFDSSTNRYEIGIPWKNDSVELSDNYEMARKRLENTEKRLAKNPEVETLYKKVIENHVEKSYVRKVDKSELEESKKQWLLPHFPVIKLDKSTTKVRVVFDASAKHSGVSLNDMIHQGPSLQNDLFDIMVRFRSQSVAIMCDIQEMYLQVGIPIPDRRYHRFLWREAPDVEPDIYEFSRLVFGVNASPFLAQLVSQCHARKNIEQFPLAAEVILKDTYMDDSMTSVNSDSLGVEMYEQLSELWKMAGMNARKWLSNSPSVLEHIPEENRAVEASLSDFELPSVKTLGVWWSAETDKFTFHCKEADLNAKMTKRTFFSKVATLYDPLGFVTPFTMRAKVMMQELWLSGIDWDEEISDEHDKPIRKWFQELVEMNQIQVSRNINFDKTTSEIHTFVDASSQAYGAVVYVRNTRNESVETNMVASKSKVAPLKTVSISRLELMAAVLGLKLTKTITNALVSNIRQTVFWSDSMNVLHWLRNQSRSFKTFVANRVGVIHDQTDPQQWRYVPTKQNPADLTTRGMTVKELSTSALWWHGPQFLQEPDTEWPENRVKPNAEGRCESKIKANASEEHNLMTVSVEQQKMSGFRLEPENYSDWTHYIRILAWSLRFVENCRLSVNERNLNNELQLSEIQNAENRVIRSVQSETFDDEYKLLCKGKNLPCSSKLLQLNPVLDEEGVMRCSSRLRYVEHLSNDSKYPIILPRNHSVTKLIVRYYHEQGEHCGTNQTLALLSSRYWVISAREAIREVETECCKCKRLKAKTDNQIMGPLPSFRVGASMRAFSETAVDFAGPFLTKQGRGKPKHKRYLCLFTCMSCRAVHLEIAYSLDTDSFLNAFFRFVSRRGFPRLMLSDNGTNFVGAVRELRELAQQIDRDKIARTAANRGVQWTFIPPGTPHFGGVHESMVKSAKRALYNIVGNADINDEELTTAFAGAESLMNSRPLTYQTSNPADDCVLTPNHFLFGQCGGQFAPEVVDTQTYNIKKRWRYVQELLKHFWARWFREFLPTLSARKKWMRKARDFVVGDVVLIVDPESTRGCWSLGRVHQVHPGRDGHVRVVTVRQGAKLFKRPTNRLCYLESSCE